MRDILITLLIFGLLPFCIMRPSIGVLTFSWLSYMNPHRLAWGFAYDFQFAKFVAAATLLGLFVSRESKKFPVDAIIVTWIILCVWMGLTTVFAFLPDDAWDGFVKTGKIQLMAFVTVLVMGTRDRIIALIWVICGSLAFYGVKGGVFGIVTGGQYRVWGPAGSFIEDNNSLALALIMAIPLMRFLQTQVHKRYQELAILAIILLCVVSVLASQSRGALLGLFAMGVMFWLKSNRKVLIGLLFVAMVPIAYTQMPQSWHDRMQTIQTYEEDGSAMSRIRVWDYTYQLANKRILGTGFRGIASDFGYRRYLPHLYAERVARNDTFPNAHSIWFGMLGQHGWPGLILFVLLGLFTWRTGSWIIRKCKSIEELRWCRDLAAMLQVSIVGYAATGTFLSMEYFDLYYHIVALMVLLHAHVKNVLQTQAVSRGMYARAPVPA